MQTLNYEERKSVKGVRKLMERKRRLIKEVAESAARNGLPFGVVENLRLKVKRWDEAISALDELEG